MAVFKYKFHCTSEKLPFAKEIFTGAWAFILEYTLYVLV